MGMENKICCAALPLVMLLFTSCNSANRETSEKYTNPVLHADYSDPDIIRVDDSYYMVTSSFNCVPGLPVLRSEDLVSWQLIGHALNRLQPYDRFNKVQHGGGVWAPCMRYHNNEFYIFYPDPDQGIFMVKAKDPAGPWSEPVLIRKGRGMIDPSPLWDDDGNAWLVYAFAGTRAGVKSVLIVSRMNSEGTLVSDDGVMVFDGHDANPTVEGPKFYKRNGYYYIFAPAGGVTNGWQLVLRAKNIYGPYEEKVVMHQGQTAVNGPHQGAWVTTETGEDWFIHFQDKGAYGRILHLQPLRWLDDWPVIGSDEDGDGTGEPVTSFKKPGTARPRPPLSLQVDDEFNNGMMGLQWQWQANPLLTWGYPSEAYGCFRLNCIPKPDTSLNLWDVPNMFLQKLPAEKFITTASLKCNLKFEGEEAGMIIMGRDYQYISLKRSEEKLLLRIVRCREANHQGREEILFTGEVNTGEIFFRISVEPGAQCKFSYTTDGSIFTEAGETFTAKAGMWIGAKIGFFALRNGFINDSGYADIDWFRTDIQK